MNMFRLSNSTSSFGGKLGLHIMERLLAPQYVSNINLVITHKLTVKWQGVNIS